MFNFVEIWNAATSIMDVAKNYGIKPLSALARARRLRATGLPLKQLSDESQAYALTHPSRKPPKPDGAATEPRPRGRPPNESKPRTTFNCHVQTMVTYETFGRLLAGERALSSGRVREIIELGLEAELQLTAESVEVEVEVPVVAAQAEHGECLDCDALILTHRAGRTHCWCGEDWPCPVLGAAPLTPSPDPQEGRQEAPALPAPAPPAFDLFGPTPGLGGAS
jgi:hypothetical protein